MTIVKLKKRVRLVGSWLGEVTWWSVVSSALPKTEKGHTKSLRALQDSQHDSRSQASQVVYLDQTLDSMQNKKNCRHMSTLRHMHSSFLTWAHWQRCPPNLNERKPPVSVQWRQRINTIGMMAQMPKLCDSKVEFELVGPFQKQKGKSRMHMVIGMVRDWTLLRLTMLKPGSGNPSKLKLLNN